MDLEDFAKKTTIDGKQARYYKLANLTEIDTDTAATSRPTAHFYGGNGFTVGSYLPLLTQLSESFTLSALAMRGYWYDKPSAKKMTREEDADVLIEFLEQTQDAPIIGIGHSQGATATAIAAAKRPELFSKLYLIEPVTFTKSQTLLYNLLPRAVKMAKEPFKSTLTKQTSWSSVQEYYNHLRQHRAYRRISDAHLFIFAEQSLMQTNDGSYQLLFSPSQELANYFGTPFIDDALKILNTNHVPYTLITGKPTLFISDKVRKNWQKIVPDHYIITFPDFGHLLPIEAPEKCAKLIIKDHLAKNSL